MLSNASTVGTSNTIFEGRRTACDCSFCKQRAVSISDSFEYDIPCPKRLIILMISTFPVKILIAHGRSICFTVRILPLIAAYIRSCENDQESKSIFALDVYFISPDSNTDRNLVV